MILVGFVVGVGEGDETAFPERLARPPALGVAAPSGLPSSGASNPYAFGTPFTPSLEATDGFRGDFGSFLK